MPIISIPETKTRGKCQIMPPYEVGGTQPYYCTAYKMYETKYPTDTIWECPECGEYAFVSKGKGSGEWRYWLPVEWFRFKIRREIVRVKSESKSVGGVL